MRTKLSEKVAPQLKNSLYATPHKFKMHYDREKGYQTNFRLFLKVLVVKKGPT